MKILEELKETTKKGIIIDGIMRSKGVYLLVSKPKVGKSYITTRGETQIPIDAANKQNTVIAKGLDLVFAITKLPTKDKIITAINPAIKIP